MKLKQYLAREGINAAEFARRIDMSEGMVSLLIAEKTWPSKDTSHRIYAETCGAVTPTDFLPAEAAE